MKEDTNYYIHYTRAQTWKYMIASENNIDQKKLKLNFEIFLKYFKF